MKTYNHIFSTTTKFYEFIEDNNIDFNSSMLLRIHTGVHEKVGLSYLIKQLKEKLPNAEIVGCTSLSVIFNGMRMTGVCMISVTLTEECYVKSVYMPCFENNTPLSGALLAEKICEKLDLKNKNGQLVAFFPQSYFNCMKFAEKISEIAPGVRIIGGIANDPQPSLIGTGKIEIKDITFNHNECGSEGVAVAIIANPDMQCFEGYALGMEQIFHSSPVTSCEENIIHSIDGKTPRQWLKELSGDHIKRKNFDMIRIFPVFRKKYPRIAWPVAFIENTELMVSSEETESIMIMDVVDENEEIGIGYLGPNAVVEEVVQLYRRLKKRPAESIFVYSCSLRASILQNCSEWELAPLKNTNASGAFLGGEFFYDGEKNYFGNCNFVISAMSLGESCMEYDTRILSDTHKLYHDNEHLVEFLALCASKANNNNFNLYKQLEARLYSDPGVELGSFMKMYNDVHALKLNKLCMLSIRNGSELIAYAGYKAYDNMLKGVIVKIQKHLKLLNVWYYMSEQGEILIAANDKTRAPEFEEIMRDLHKYLTRIEYNRMRPVFEFCLVVNQKHLFRNAKIVQSILRNRNDLSFLVFSPEMGMEENCIRDVQMVQIISEAITNNRVLPFYQGIHDNSQQEITMYESLMRITDAEGKIYYPNEFLHIAKKYGLYNQLSYQMVEKVLKTFENRNELVTVNLSMHDILDPKMTELIYAHMVKSKDPSRFIFEVVESEDVTDYESMTMFSEKIHVYGCKLALDDFGSGFSNLIHVIKMDLDYLKLDGGIIRKICEDEGCQKLLEIVTHWCKINGKKLIAEFVENNAIQEILCKYDVDYSQGYLFSRPSKHIED